MKKDKFFGKIERFKALKHHRPYSVSMHYPMPDLTVLTKEERDYHLKQIDAWEKDKFSEYILSLANDVLAWFLHKSHGRFQTPIPKFEEHADTAKTMDLAVLLDNSEHEAAEIDVIHTAIKGLKEQFLTDDALQKVDRAESFTMGSAVYKKSFTIYGRDALAKFQDEIKEKITILEAAIEWHTMVQEIFDNEAAQRKKDKPTKLSGILASLKAVTNEAAAQRKLMLKNFEKCQNSKLKDKSSARSFTDAWQRFNELRSKYKALHRQLFLFTIQVNNVNIPEFPPGLPLEQLRYKNKIECLGKYGTTAYAWPFRTV